MAFEVEAKAWLHQPAEVEALAAQLGPLEKEVFKEDIYFRRQGQTDPLPADRFRLRREGEHSVVTFKQTITASGVEVNQEVEFGVDDRHAFFQFAQRFGFEPFVVKRKHSRVYQIERASAEFNQVEHLGHFLEIEILCNEEAFIPVARTEVARLFNRLGLSGSDLESRRYIVLIQEAHPVRYRFIDDRSLDWPFVEETI